MWLDVRHALRGLKRTPGFSLVTILSLALAIGATGSIFSLIDGLWFRPPGVADPGSLVWIFSTSPDTREGAFSFPEYRDVRDRTSSFSGVVARGRRGALLGTDTGTPDLVLVNVVSTNFFEALGVRAHVGRLFTPADESALAEQPGVVLGYAFWQRRFGGDPSIVGRTIAIERGTALPVTVLGVLPASFRDLDAAADRDLWMPPQTWARQTNATEFEQRDYRWFELFATLRPGAAAAGARAEVAALAQTLAATYPSTNAGRGATLVTDRQHRLENGGVSAMALAGVVLLVMLITCVNVANLLLARAATRVREVAMRLALGATRARVVRELLTESLVLGAAGAAAGALISVWLVSALPAIIVQPPGLPSFLVFAADQRMIVSTLTVALATTLLFGLVPGWIASRVPLVPLIKGEWMPGSTPRQHRTVRAGLAAAQVALSLAMVCSAAVLGRSFLETRRADIGFERKPILTAWSTFEALTPALEGEAIARLRALPGVTGVAIAIRAPLSLSGGGMSEPVVFHDRPQDPASGPPAVKYNAVTSAYFRTMGTRVVRGRAFTEDERSAAVALVNERFAAQYFPGDDAVGKVVGIGGRDRRIVGVVQNAAINRVGEAPEAYLYVPLRANASEVTFLIAAQGDAARLAGPAREALRALDARLAPRRLVTMQELVAYSARDYRMTATLVGALGAIGLLLTTLGIYGVVAYNATQRTKELGIRSAIGATRGQLVAVVFNDGLRLTAIGLAIGLPLALVATRLLASFLFGTAPWDPSSFALAAATVTAATMIASLIPALRASGVKVSEALRQG